MRKVSLWRRLGTRVQVLIVCLLVLTLAASLTAMIQTEVRGTGASSQIPFALVPPTPTPDPTPWHVIDFPDWDDDLFTWEHFDPRPVSLLTGFHVEEEELTRRPIAIVINNPFAAHPHSGIGSADIVYEVLAEGPTTRLVAVFQSYIPEKIGPVRSARDYFVDFAFNHDAFFVHHGGSPTGYERIRRLLGPRNSIDGMRFERIVFWRDRSFPYWTGYTGQRAMEHSSYTGRYELLEHFYESDIRTYLSGDINDMLEYGFIFGTVPVGPEPAHSDVSRVVVPFAATAYTVFDLNHYTGLFDVSHARGAWIDELTRLQLSVANVLIQHTVIRAADGYGRRNVTTVGSGTGYLVRNGFVFNVTWHKSSHTSPMQWFFEDGTPLVLAPGRTWINVLQTSAIPTFYDGLGEQYGT